MKYIVAVGMVAGLVVFGVNWGEVLFFQLLIRSVLVGLGFILALTAAKKAIATFVLSSGTSPPSAPQTGGEPASSDRSPPPDTPPADAGLDESDETVSGDEEPASSQGEEEVDPGQIAEMISGQMSGDEG